MRRPRLSHHLREDTRDDTDAGTDPSGMNCRDHTGLLVGEQNGNTVCAEGGERQAGNSGDQSIRHGNHFVGRFRHDSDVARVDLFHPHEMVRLDAYFACQTSAIRIDGCRIVSDVIAEIERLVR